MAVHIVLVVYSHIHDIRRVYIMKTTSLQNYNKKKMNNFEDTDEYYLVISQSSNFFHSYSDI